MTGQCLCGCTVSHKCSIHDGFEYPYPPDIARRLDDCLAVGNTAIIEIMSPGEYVRKSPHPHACTSEKARQARQLMREVQIYKRLPAHNRLLKMVEYSDDKLEGYIVFEHMRNGSLESYLESGAAISYNQQLRWCIQAAEGVALLHASGIVHADIKPQNMLLDDKMSIRIIDMSGSSIDGLPPLCLESTRFFLPRPMDADMPCSITTDLFALGSSLYQIMQRVQPYAELEADKVELNYKRHIFPDVANLPCGSIISKCWQSQRTSSLPQRRSTGNLIATMILRQHSALWEKFRHEPCETDVGRSWGRARMKEKSPNKEAVRQQAGHYDGYWSNFKGARCL